MTPFNLQDDLINELKKVFDGFKLKNEKEEYVDINFFSQSLSIRSTEEDVEPFPYIIVRLNEGNIEANESIVTTQILIGIYDDSEEANGHKDVINIIQKIHERFFKNPSLYKKYVIQNPFKWVLQEEDTHPYYFGGIENTWYTATYAREDRFA